MGQGFLHQPAELFDEGSGRDRDQVAAEGEEPPREGVAPTHPEGPVLGMAGDWLAQAECRSGSAGGGGELDGRGDRVAGAELPALPRTRMLLDVEALGDLILVENRLLAADAQIFHPVHPEILDGELTRCPGG